MRSMRARVTSKGQITVPVEIRRRLGVEPGDTISFAVEEDGIRMEAPAGSVVERTAGALRGGESANPREASEESIAKEYVERSES